jgi:hypothetical protein
MRLSADMHSRSCAECPISSLCRELPRGKDPGICGHFGLDWKWCLPAFHERGTKVSQKTGAESMRLKLAVLPAKASTECCASIRSLPGITVRRQLPLLPCVIVALIPAAGLLWGQQSLRPAIPLEELLSPGLRVKYQSKPSYKDRLDVYREALNERDSQLRAELKKLNLDGIAEGLAAMRALAAFAISEPTRKSASPKDLRSKTVKDLEIRIRKLVLELVDFRLSVPPEFHGNFDSTIGPLNDLRNQLLRQLFEKQPPRI